MTSKDPKRRRLGRDSAELELRSADFYVALGRAIKTMRTARGIERAALAEASGVSYPYLSEIENGRKRASSDALMAIAEALGVTLAELMSAAQEMKEFHGASNGPNVVRSEDPAYYSRSRESWFRTQMRTDFDAPMTPNTDVDELKAMLDRVSPEDLPVVRALIERLLR